MVQVKLTRPEFDAKKEELLASQGITLKGDTGVVNKDGISIGYTYGDDELLSLSIVKHPMLEPTSLIQERLATWVGGDIV